MLYFDHGLERDFTSYDNYFDGGQDEDAITYLGLANRMMQEIRPGALSLAEDMSGYPGLAAPLESGGVGFSHRLAMGIPDFWIKTIKELPDEQWNMEELFHELTSKRADEKTIGYAESHDQALVGDKTIIFRLIDKEMYWHMNKDDRHPVVERGIALHKMIRLLTAATSGNGYLNFMGNEFGHPEWIDFPREGNNWSYQYARRQWSLIEDKALKYHFLSDFDRAMLQVLGENGIFDAHCQHVKSDRTDLVLAFERKGLLFVFNFHPNVSYTDYGLAVDAGKFRPILGTDEGAYGGFAQVDMKHTHHSMVERSFGLKQQLKLYLPARTGLVLKRQSIPRVR
jgi:1,4-alpha-glucan branching enzyme